MKWQFLSAWWLVAVLVAALATACDRAPDNLRVRGLIWGRRLTKQCKRRKHCISRSKGRTSDPYAGVSLTAIRNTPAGRRQWI